MLLYTLLGSSRAVFLYHPFLLSPVINRLKKAAPAAGSRALTRRVWSQEPEQNAVPSGDTRKVLTRFSCPNRMDTRDPFSTSQTLMV